MADDDFDAWKASIADRVRGGLAQYFVGANQLRDAMTPKSMGDVGNMALYATPGVGNALSARDAYNSASEGDWMGSALGGIGAIPLFGGILSSALKKGPFISPAISYNGKILRGVPGESHDATAARHGLDGVSLAERSKAKSGFIDDNGRFYTNDDDAREEAFRYAKYADLLKKQYSKMPDDTGLHATMLQPR